MQNIQNSKGFFTAILFKLIRKRWAHIGLIV